MSSSDRLVWRGDIDGLKFDVEAGVAGPVVVAAVNPGVVAGALPVLVVDKALGEVPAVGGTRTCSSGILIRI